MQRQQGRVALLVHTRLVIPCCIALALAHPGGAEAQRSHGLAATGLPVVTVAVGEERVRLRALAAKCDLGLGCAIATQVPPCRQLPAVRVRVGQVMEWQFVSAPLLVSVRIDSQANVKSFRRQYQLGGRRRFRMIVPRRGIATIFVLYPGLGAIYGACLR
jgi:hypothetical protein